MKKLFCSLAVMGLFTVLGAQPAFAYHYRLFVMNNVGWSDVNVHIDVVKYKIKNDGDGGWTSESDTYWYNSIMGLCDDFRVVSIGSWTNDKFKFKIQYHCEGTAGSSYGTGETITYSSDWDKDSGEDKELYIVITGCDSSDDASTYDDEPDCSYND